MNRDAAALACGSAADGLATRDVPAGGVTTRELLIWAALIFAANSAAQIWSAAVSSGTNHASWSAIELIVWGCAGKLVWRDPARRAARPHEIVVIVSVLAISVMLAANGAYAGSFVIGLMTLYGRGWSPDQRRFGLILVSIVTYRLVSKLVVTFLADIILQLDTAVAGIALSLVVPGSTWSTNTIQPPHGIGITVAMACSSFANLSLVSLCYTGIAMLDRAIWSMRNCTAIAGVWLVVIVANTVRLVLMARSLDAYEYWHNGNGSDLFGIGMSMVTMVCCSLGSKWANSRP